MICYGVVRNKMHVYSLSMFVCISFYLPVLYIISESNNTFGLTPMQLACAFSFNNAVLTWCDLSFSGKYGTYILHSNISGFNFYSVNLSSDSAKTRY